jgi:hypothetical protein
MRKGLLFAKIKLQLPKKTTERRNARLVYGLFFAGFPFGPTLITVNRPCTVGFEGNLGLFTTVCTHSREGSARFFAALMIRPKHTVLG